MKLKEFNKTEKSELIYYIRFNDSRAREYRMVQMDRSNGFQIHLYTVEIREFDDNPNVLENTIENIVKCLAERDNQRNDLQVINRNTNEVLTYRQFMDKFNR